MCVTLHFIWSFHLAGYGMVTSPGTWGLSQTPGSPCMYVAPKPRPDPQWRPEQLWTPSDQGGR